MHVADTMKVFPGIRNFAYQCCQSERKAERNRVVWIRAAGLQRRSCWSRMFNCSHATRTGADYLLPQIVDSLCLGFHLSLCVVDGKEGCVDQRRGMIEIGQRGFLDGDAAFLFEARPLLGRSHESSGDRTKEPILFDLALLLVAVTDPTTGRRGWKAGGDRSSCLQHGYCRQKGHLPSAAKILEAIYCSTTFDGGEIGLIVPRRSQVLGKMLENWSYALHTVSVNYAQV